MGEGSKIEWTDHTFNPWWGCARVSPGCEHCYAETFAKRTGHKVWGVQADRRFFGDKHWAEPRAWDLAAAEHGTRARVFCASMADVFEDRRDLDPWRRKLFALIEETPSLDWLLLTKRPEHVMELVPGDWRDGFPDNVWLGTTTEDQRRADDRVSVLLQCPAAVRFVSAEPLLERVDLFAFLKTPLRDECLTALGDNNVPGIDWVIVGGESGPGARPFNLAWASSIVEQCKAAGVACFVKQLGALPVLTAAGADVRREDRVRLRDRKGGDMQEWPEALRVRQFPEPRA